MITIILPGYSVKNKEWAKEVKEKLSLGHNVLVHEWKHWESLGTSLSISYEREKILGKIGKEKINVIAKSVGTRVLMNLVPDTHHQLKKIILCGIPTRFESETPRELYKKGLKLPSRIPKRMPTPSSLRPLSNNSPPVISATMRLHLF